MSGFFFVLQYVGCWGDCWYKCIGIMFKSFYFLLRIWI